MIHRIILYFRTRTKLNLPCTCEWVPSAASPKCPPLSRFKMRPPDMKPYTKWSVISDVVTHSVLTVSLISVSVVLLQEPVQVEAIGNLESKPFSSTTVVNGQQSLWVFKLTLRVLVCYHVGPLLSDLVLIGISFFFCIVADSSVTGTFKEKTSGPK